MVSPSVIRQITPILERHRIRRAFIFGSAARGEQTPQSDLDLLVEFSAPTGLFAFSGLNRELEEATGQRVDLATPKGLSKYIRDRVLAEAQVIYEQGKR